MKPKAMPLVKMISIGIEGTATSGRVPIKTSIGAAISKKYLICLHTLQVCSAIDVCELCNCSELSHSCC